MKNIFKSRIFRNIFTSLGFGNLPNFLILGGRKCGTTSLYRYITLYASNFKEPRQKEINFFSMNFQRGINFYKSFFPVYLKSNQKTGEASPTYLFYHKSASRMKQILPNGKFIIILRNPIDVAFSTYNHLNFSKKSKAYDPFSFEETVNDPRNWAYLDEKVDIDFNYSYHYYSHVCLGMYYPQIQRYFKHFNQEQFLILDFEDLKNSPEKILNEVFDFTGLEFNDKPLKFKAFNRNRYENELTKETRELLRDIYKPHNEKLFTLLGRKFDWD